MLNFNPTFSQEGFKAQPLKGPKLQAKTSCIKFYYILHFFSFLHTPNGAWATGSDPLQTTRIPFLFLPSKQFTALLYAEKWHSLSPSSQSHHPFQAHENPITQSSPHESHHNPFSSPNPSITPKSEASDSPLSTPLKNPKAAASLLKNLNLKSRVPNKRKMNYLNWVRRLRRQ